MKGMGIESYLVTGIIVLVLGLAMLNATGWTWPEQGAIVGGTCQNIYGYYPAFRCCDEEQTSEGTYTVGYGGYWQCPVTASRCEVRGGSIDSWYRGSTGCGADFLGLWNCQDSSKISYNNWVNIEPGEFIFTRQLSTHSFEYKVYDDKLCECSLSPCGIPCPKVLGSAGCGFVTSDEIYDENYNLVVDGVFLPGQGYSYTIPQDSCYVYYPESNRHPIGNTCEECSETSDCASRYGLKYNYMGIEYGAVCSSGYVQLYDCMASGGDICVKEREDENGNHVGCSEYAKSSRCDLYLSIPVECCPFTSSCGPQSFCNPDTYTCETTAQCTIDSDCGKTVQCDYSTNILKTPKCSGGQCTFSEEQVDCCIDENCAEGWFCDSDYTCKEKPATKQPCPYECCQGETYYFDRQCAPTESFCCPDHNCAVSQEYCSSSPPLTEDNYWWVLIPIFGILLGLIGYRLGGTVTAGIFGIVGGIMGYAVYWFTLQPWWIQWLIGIGLVGGGGLTIWVFGGAIASFLLILLAFLLKR